MQSDHGAALIQHLPFDSDCFGLEMARVDWFWAEPGTASVLIDQILSAALNQNIQHLMIRVEANQLELVKAWQSHGFYLADTQATLTHNYLTTPPLPTTNGWRSGQIDRFKTDHLPAIKALSRDAYRQSRFYADPALSHSGADHLHMRWAENNCRGRADSTWVAHQNGQVFGYLSCLYSASQAEFGLPAQAHIDLVAVDATVRGDGIGSRLIAMALAHYWDQANLMTVGTQGYNYSALRAYIKLGFILDRLQFSLHGVLGVLNGDHQKERVS